jgi:hypothetical protein
MEIFLWFESEAEDYKDVVPFKTVITDLALSEFTRFWEQILEKFPIR